MPPKWWAWSPVGEGLVVGTEDYFVPGPFQPEAQAAGAAEEVGGQALTLLPEPFGVLEKRLNVVGVVAVRREMMKSPRTSLTP